jgi:hypothetical protein
MRFVYHVTFARMRSVLKQLHIIVNTSIKKRNSTNNNDFIEITPWEKTYDNGVN